MKSKILTIDVSYLKRKANSEPVTSPVKRARRKLRILERDGFKCVNCGSTHNLTIDHYKRPSIKNHHDSHWYKPSCCKTLCEECHIEKNRTMDRVPYKK